MLKFFTLCIFITINIFANSSPTPIKDFLRQKIQTSSVSIQDSFKESYEGVILQGKTEDVIISPIAKIEALNSKKQRKNLFKLLKLAKEHLKTSAQNPLSFEDPTLWDYQITNDFVAIIDSAQNPQLFQITYIEHLLAVKNFREFVLSTIDDQWSKKAQLKKLIDEMLFVRAIGQTGILHYLGKDGKHYISLGTDHPKGGGLVPSGFLTRSMSSNTHLLSDTLQEEAYEELSPLINISTMKKRTLGYSFNRITKQNANYYDAELFSKLEKKNIDVSQDVAFIRGLFITLEIEESESEKIFAAIKSNPGIDFKKEVGNLRFETIQKALEILKEGRNGKVNAEHVSVLEAYKSSML